MSSFLACLHVVRSPNLPGLTFFRGRPDFCTFHIQETGGSEVRMLFLYLGNFRKMDEDKIEITGRATFQKSAIPLKMIVDGSTGKGRIIWCVDANGSVDPWPHLLPFSVAAS